MIFPLIKHGALPKKCAVYFIHFTNQEILTGIQFSPGLENLMVG
jgi:hypothetical protein